MAFSVLKACLQETQTGKHQSREDELFLDPNIVKLWFCQWFAVQVLQIRRMIGKLQRKMSTKCFSESHARQKEMCFLKVLLADEYFSAIIKVVKSSLPAPHTHERWWDLHASQNQIWESDISLRRSSTLLSQQIRWGKAQHGPAHVGQLLVLCHCAAEPRHQLAPQRCHTTETGLIDHGHCHCVAASSHTSSRK